MTVFGPMTSVVADDVLLSAERLQMHFPVRRGLLQRKVGAVQAVDGLTFDVRRGETLSLVGESGCGKTTLGRLLLGLDRPDEGVVQLAGSGLDDLHRRTVRRRLQPIFQEAESSSWREMRAPSIPRTPL